jgi:hypothetical protein
MPEHEEIFVITEHKKKCDICGTEITKESPCKACAKALEDVFGDGLRPKWYGEGFLPVVIATVVTIFCLYWSCIEVQKWRHQKQRNEHENLSIRGIL